MNTECGHFEGLLTFLLGFLNVYFRQVGQLSCSEPTKTPQIDPNRPVQCPIVIKNKNTHSK